MSVKVSQLTKFYGSQKAVNAISFEAKKGEVLGFLGPNGAGKSTTMKMATGYIPPTEGSIEVCGLDAVKDSQKVRQVIGYLPEHNPLYLDMYVKEYLKFIGGVHGLGGNDLKERISVIIQECGLQKEQGKQIGQLSKGYRQRVGLAQALLHDPEVLILDEPTTGLDPNQLVEIRQLIKRLAKDKTVILSTHIMQEVQAICDRVVVINNGEIVANETIDQIKGSVQVLKIEFQVGIEEAALRAFGNVHSVAHNTYTLRTRSKKDIRPEIFELAKSKNWVILSMSKEEQDLESFFHDKTKGKT